MWELHSHSRSHNFPSLVSKNVRIRIVFCFNNFLVVEKWLWMCYFHSRFPGSEVLCGEPIFEVPWSKARRAFWSIDILWSEIARSSFKIYCFKIYPSLREYIVERRNMQIHPSLGNHHATNRDHPVNLKSIKFENSGSLSSKFESR